MTLETPDFVHDFSPGAIHYGRGCVADLGDAFADRGLERAVIVCGRNVGANRDAIDPIEAGLGDRLAAVFDETTPEKRIETAYDGVDVVREVDADALVAVGAGSSHDLAKAIGVLHADFRTPEEIVEEFREEGTVSVPDANDLPPLFSVPTTFAGADISTVGGGSVPGDDGERIEVAVADPALMPTALFYDPSIYETTPIGVLAGSAFNGLDKAIEMIYSRHANPLTDATSVRGLRYLRDGLPRLRETDDPTVMDRAVIGIVLAQYGLAARGSYKANVVHAFGHGLRRVWGVQQGVAHAVMAPRVLRLLFDAVDGRRDLLAAGFGVADADDPADAVVGVVEEIRDGLGLPERLRDVEDTDEERIREVAEVVHADPFIRYGPEGFDPTVDAVESAIRAAW